jgi:hypothetical protein
MKPWAKMTVQERLALWEFEETADLLRDAQRPLKPALWSGLEVFVDGKWTPAALRTGGAA